MFRRLPCSKAFLLISPTKLVARGAMYAEKILLSSTYVYILIWNNHKKNDNESTENNYC